MPEVVRQDDEIPIGIEQLALAEEASGVALAQESAARASSAVQNQHGVPHHSVWILLRTADSSVVQLHFREGLAALEAVVAGNEVGFDGDGIRLRQQIGYRKARYQQDRKHEPQHRHGQSIASERPAPGVPAASRVRSDPRELELPRRNSKGENRDLTPGNWGYRSVKDISISISTGTG